MKALLKEIWQVYLPKISREIYNLVLKPRSSIGWTAGILLAYSFLIEGGIILEVISVINAIPAAILCFKNYDK